MAQSTSSTTNLPPPFPYTRLDINNAVVIAVDYQEGLFNLVRDILPQKLKSNLLCHASLASLFNLPIILTTTDDTGPNGPIMKEFREMHPDAPFIRRVGEVNAFDNPEFRAALKATGRKQVIIGALLTEVCTTFLALSLRAEGYDVWANVQGSASAEKETSDHAYNRMREAGVHILDSLSIAMEMMRDWRNTPGAAEVLPWMDQYVPAYGMLARAHLSATKNAKAESKEMET
ncbi:Isochorismatase-like protein [Xylogone sp. PMI_703]|nr:Isochorismatase-like protein [Xylogone sp. PMI_703]